MRQKISAFLKSDSFRELFLYVVIGVLTTAVSYATYAAATRLIMAALGRSEISVGIADAGTVIQHIVAIAFAFVTNKKFVFHTPVWRGKPFWREAWTFTTARLLSVALDLALMALAVGVLRMDDRVAKLIIQVIIVVVNYFASKFWVFKKEK